MTPHSATQADAHSTNAAISGDSLWKIESDILEQLEIDKETLTPIPTQECFRAWYTKKLRDFPCDEERTKIDVSPEKGRILRAITPFSAGDLILFEHPALQITEYGVDPEPPAPEVELDAYGDSDGDGDGAQDPEAPDEATPVRFYPPAVVSRAYPDLKTTYEEQLLASSFGLQGDFVTIVSRYAALPVKTRRRLADLYAPDPERHTCAACGPTPRCSVCREMERLQRNNVAPLRRLFAHLGIGAAELQRELIHACLAFSVNCFELSGRCVGVFSRICMCSHSCMANAVWEWSHLARRMKLTACRHIRAGEEITVSYLSDDDMICPRLVRRMALRSTHYFVCSCPRCLAEDPRAIELVAQWRGSALRAATLPDEVFRREENRLPSVQRRALNDFLHAEPWNAEIVSAVTSGALDLIGSPLLCDRCAHVWYDLFVPVPQSARRGCRVTALGAMCPACGAIVRSDNARRNELVGIWLACLERPLLFENPARAQELPGPVIEQMTRIIRYAVGHRAGGFLAGSFTYLLSLLMFNTRTEPGRAVLLLATALKCFRDTLFGRWFDAWLMNPFFVPLCEMAARLGMRRLAAQIARKVWHLDVAMGTESEDELAWVRAHAQLDAPQPPGPSVAPTPADGGPTARSPLTRAAPEAPSEESYSVYEEEEEEGPEAVPLSPLGCFSEKHTPLAIVCAMLDKTHWVRKLAPF